MYFTNKSTLFNNAETNTDSQIQMDLMLHEDYQTKMNKTKVQFNRQQTRSTHEQQQFQIEKLYFDPSPIGRYKNFQGASSKIANYIKSLDQNVRNQFIVEDKYHDYLKQSTCKKKECEKLKRLIDHHNNLYTFNLRGCNGLPYYKKSKNRSPRKLNSIVSYRQQSDLSFQEEMTDIGRIHATQRGRKIKPLRKVVPIQQFFDSQLQPLKKSYKGFQN